MSDSGASYNSYISEVQSLMKMDSSGSHVTNRRRPDRRRTTSVAELRYSRDAESRTARAKKAIEEQYKQVKNGSFRSYATVFNKEERASPPSAVSEPPLEHSRPVEKHVMDDLEAMPSPLRDEVPQSPTPGPAATIPIDVPPQVKSRSPTPDPTPDPALPSMVPTLPIQPALMAHTPASAPAPVARSTPSATPSLAATPRDHRPDPTVADLQAEVARLEGEVAKLEGQMATKDMVIQEITGLRSHINTVEQTMYDTRQRAGAVERALSAVQASVGTLRTDHGALSGRVGAIESRSSAGRVSRVLWKAVSMGLHVALAVVAAFHSFVGTIPGGPARIARLVTSWARAWGAIKRVGTRTWITVAGVAGAVAVVVLLFIIRAALEIVVTVSSRGNVVFVF